MPQKVKASIKASSPSPRANRFAQALQAAGVSPRPKAPASAKTLTKKKGGYK